MEIQSFQSLIVWQKSVDLVDLIYDLTANFPTEEKYGLASQMRRCSVSIPSNIAEGQLRGTRNDYARFIAMAFGSSGELQTQLIISLRRKYILENEYSATLELLTEVMKMLGALHRKLKPKT